MHRAIRLLLPTILFLPTAAAAQRISAVALNPIAAVQLDLVGEAETTVRPRLSVGVTWNRSRSEGTNESGTERTERLWKSVDAVARYYWSGRAPDGLSVGLTAGHAWTTRWRTLDFGAGAGTDAFSAAQWTLGGRFDYNRTFRSRIHVGLGVGAKLGVMQRGDDFADMPLLIPSLRTVVGMRF